MEHYLSKWLELKRTYDRLVIQLRQIDQFDSFQTPQDYIRNFFSIGYSLKEALKIYAKYNQSKWDVEEFVNSNDYIALSIDFANKDKHITLSSKRSAKNI